METKGHSFESSRLLTLFAEKTGHVDVQFGTVTIAPGEEQCQIVWTLVKSK